ncbi:MULTISPECIES: transcription antitermination factor NusB [Novosphingobium]|uniref:transcription antitermination factor NusB n=1 Tax=Novosphingobium TaxID=165696 RepID=UPI001CD5FBEB|nr:transcription antitermination factor NusB [Novosphingobium percolationis]MCH7629939.1 transcription antitermination factor NusB [Pseudomonadota bacterium]
MSSGKDQTRARSAARLAAVQALYQVEMESPELHLLLDEFHMHRLGAEIEDVEYAPADVAFFDDVVRGVVARRDEIDTLLASKLAEGWSLPRLDRTMLQILRAGTWELMARNDITVGTVINEYLDVAHAFFDKREAKFANGVLDAVAKAVR